MITAIPALSDNYIWIVETNHHEALIVDPGEAQPVLDYLEAHELEPKVILLTHKHEDHVGGVKTLVTKYPDMKVVGPEETYDYNTQTISPGESIELLGDKYRVLPTYGHTSGHVSYITDTSAFVGDALFAGGCGRVFTNDYGAGFAGMQTLRDLPDDLNVYAGHEYTVTNLTFAHDQAPENEAIAEALTEAKQLQADGQPTLPTTIAHEKETNLLLMAKDEATFKQLRDIRDTY
ncbi:hydroxyacylglutathione hydrolase [Aerococcus suis]|uniref:Hydroxyacylglutathione hydrolase n=1 Tax=Aerococcus suis TaxID=371602 RepID=A0A1W1Z0S3_9LACT|nr:hydroxyacylglutathione hydrolase [Aerococcus suis]MCI7240737.1 hydroxyacylglutathione hydrolase [Aerococcus suis]MDD7758525.1 hydroxyacylglutathione hydrolase [Aerococcus suis]MDY4646188.1 hydroxyacylglutathione hydrolase [Aerococcus suis]SMC42040.1 hydroxyacylglutathione hydrolase [Aerococcus suis]